MTKLCCFVTDFLYYMQVPIFFCCFLDILLFVVVYLAGDFDIFGFVHIC